MVREVEEGRSQGGGEGAMQNLKMERGRSYQTRAWSAAPLCTAFYADMPHALQCSAVQCSAILQCSAVYYNTQCSAVQFSTIHSAVQCSLIQYTVQCSAV